VAIAAGDVDFWRALREGGFLPSNPRVLEIGEANWYGDLPAASVPEITHPCPADTWDTAKAFYRGLMGAGTTFTAIDRNGTAAALKLDLNQPVPSGLLGEPFDLVINCGTAEHVFDQCQLFRTIHDWAKAGALIVHSVPLSGWPDHGFFNYHPGLFRDLARSNGYEICQEMLWEHRASRNVAGPWKDVMPVSDLAMGIALRKTHGGAFRVPQQGRYAAA
jgi:hypothetical protein